MSVVGDSSFAADHPAVPRTVNTSLFYDSQQMRNLCNDTAHSRRIGPGDSLVEFGYAQRFDHCFLLFRKPDRATIILYRDRAAAGFLFLLCHYVIPTLLQPYLADELLPSGLSFEANR